MQWHTKSVESVLETLETNKKGITHMDAEGRLKFYGLNKLKEKKRRTVLTIFYEQFKSILVLILVFATLLSAFLGFYVDAVVIGLILILNALLGLWQEFKAEKAIDALKKLTVSNVTVMRDGHHNEISVERLVPGDIVILEEGSKVPADMRLFEVSNLKMNESELTGESVPSTKDVGTLKDVSIGERKNMTFMGTVVSYGRGMGIVVATGMSTEIGKIATLVDEREDPTPLQTKLQHFGKDIGIFVGILAFLIFILGIFRNEDIVSMILTAISLSVASVPEGLPAVVTLTLTLGTQKMLKRNAVIKRLAAVEALGSVTVICSDKTGTMTTNEMTVEKVWYPNKTINVTGVGFEPKGEFLSEGNRIDPKEDAQLQMILRISKMCNDSVLKEGEWKIIGDPTEGALKVLAKKAHFEEDCPRVKEIPFSSERKIMSTVHDIKGNYIAYAKGAPEFMLRCCNKMYPNKELTKKERDTITRTIHELADDGLRVLGFAYKKLGMRYSVDSVEKNMTFVGLVAMMDPPRKETKAAIKLCREAGIKVVMLTGDHPITAKAIASQIGLGGDVISGDQIDKMTEEEFEDAVDETIIFARVSPEHKLKIVEALKKKKNIVAVTGDGVNDAPALKKADIGIAMGIKGTDVAKEAADMILLDDNFNTIVAAVEEGRSIYDNIKKFVRFLLSANFNEMFTVVSTMILGLPIPFLPTQILWINLVTDGLPALSLGVDPKDKDIMQRKPRNPKEAIMHSSFPFIMATGILGFLATLFTFLTELPSGLEKARTMAFTTTLMFQLFLVFNCRSDKKSVFRLNPFANKKLVASVAFSIMLQLIVLYVPMLQATFHTVPLDVFDWLKVLVLSSLGLLVLPEIFMKKSIKSIDYME
ncbi:MAG: cation-translocating P-type ATPase [Candidatus Aenigmatarchaeota archaeon]